MSTSKSKDEVSEHKKAVIADVDQYLNELIQSDDKLLISKADKLSYWLKDYINFLKFEEKFDPSKYPKYKKGQIVKVHLGFNIGSEEGGLHYAIVIDNNNSVNSPILNIVPLTSVKSDADISKIRTDLGNIYLGNELYLSLETKLNMLHEKVRNELESLTILVDHMVERDPGIPDAKKRLKDCKDKLKFIKNIQREISKMKIGSIALVGQITTISKIRIYDPKSTQDVLGNIRMSNKTMDLIDSTIKQLFTKQE